MTLLAAIPLANCASLVGADFGDAHLAQAGDSSAGVGASYSYGGDASPAVANGGTAAAFSGSVGGEPSITPTAGGGDSAGGTPDPNGPGDSGGAGGVESVGAHCPSGPNFVDVGSLPPPGDGSPSAEILASGVARLDRVAPDEHCQAVLLSARLFLTIDCAADARDTLVFGAKLAPGMTEPESSLTYQVQSVADAGERFTLGSFVADPFTWTTLRLPFLARAPKLGELVTVITHRADGFARAARVHVDVDLFDQPSTPSDMPSDVSSVFDADGRLVGFCAFDECLRPRGCVSMSTLIGASSALRTLSAMSGLFLGDATGDGKVDFTAIDIDGVGLRRSNGNGLSPGEWWVLSPYFGARQNLVADFNGDGLADLAVVNNDYVAVRTSDGSAYGSQSSWLAGQFWGELGTHAGNVDGQGGADLAIVEAGQVTVRRSLGSSFDAAEDWGSIDSDGLVQVELTDLTHDGRADRISVYGDRIEVAASAGDHFEEAHVWLAASTPSSGYFFADVTGDGASDAVRLERNLVQVFAAGSEAFQPASTTFRTAPPIGARANYFADVTGDGRADAITLDNEGLRVSPSTGSDFLAPQAWAVDPFYGGI